MYGELGLLKQLSHDVDPNYKLIKDRQAAGCFCIII